MKIGVLCGWHALKRTCCVGGARGAHTCSQAGPGVGSRGVGRIGPIGATQATVTPNPPRARESRAFPARPHNRRPPPHHHTTPPHHAGDLFDFDYEVEPILEVLMAKVLEQGLMEVRGPTPWPGPLTYVLLLVAAGWLACCRGFFACCSYCCLLAALACLLL